MSQPPRITPLPIEEWDPELRERFAGDDAPLNIFATLARHPKLLKRWVVFANHVLTKSTLPPRDRELLILRAGWRCQSPYEWAQHVQIGLRDGIAEHEIAMVAEGPEASGWSAFDATLLRACDELHDTGRLTDATWAALAERYTEEQLLEVPMTVGQYHLVSFVLNTCRVPLDASVPEPAVMPAAP